MPTKLTDEQRVRAAVPDAVCVWGCTRFEVTAPSYMGGRLILGSGKDVPSAWHAALQHHTVQAYERTHANVETQEQIEMGGTGSADTGVIPSKGEHMADTPELPEMDVTEEEKALGRSKVFAMFGEGRSDLTRELINSEAELFCRERQLREAHATIAALRQKNKCVDCRDYEANIRTWIGQLGGNSAVSHISLELERLIADHAQPAPLTGPAMEAMVRACAEAVWQMYREPHNLTWDALKEGTFEALAALVVETQGALLERVRALEANAAEEERAHLQTLAERDQAEDSLGDAFVFVTGRVAEWSNVFSYDDATNEMAAFVKELQERAEAAEAKVRDLDAAVPVDFQKQMDHDAGLISALQGDVTRLRTDRNEWRRRYFEMERAQSRSIDQNGEHIKRIQFLEREKDEIRSRLAVVEAAAGAARAERHCIPGDMKPMFLLRFDDSDMREMIFDSEEEARGAWGKYKDSWNCWLFGPLSEPKGASK